MKFRVSRGWVAAYVLIGLMLNCLPAPNAHAGSADAFCSKQLNGTTFARTELFFGLTKPDGSVVTEEEFQLFLKNEVTPRFPAGLTLLSGYGQFRDAAGTLIKEGSKLLILLYPFSPKSSKAVEGIRKAYKDAFQQESVLRVDEQSCVSF